MHHELHPDIIKRLKRANGHLNKVITMIEEDQACLSVAQQLQAVHSAIGNAKQLLVQQHIEHCIEHDVSTAPDDIKAQMRELKEITKYL